MVDKSGSMKGELLQTSETEDIYQHATRSDCVVVDSKHCEDTQMLNASIYAFLNISGVPTSFASTEYNRGPWIEKKCTNVPLQWIASRSDTGVVSKKGSPPVLIEIFCNDASRPDNLWTIESVKVFSSIGRLSEGQVEKMFILTRLVFQLLEHATESEKLQLLKLKVRFGIEKTSGKLVLVGMMTNSSLEFNEELPENYIIEKIDPIVFRDRFFYLSHPNRPQVGIIIGSGINKDSIANIKAIFKKYLITYRVLLSADTAKDTSVRTMTLAEKFDELEPLKCILTVIGNSIGLTSAIAVHSSLPIIAFQPLHNPTYVQGEASQSNPPPRSLISQTYSTQLDAAAAVTRIISKDDKGVWSKIKTEHALELLRLKDQGLV